MEEFILVAGVCTAFAAFCLLGLAPGRIARKRGHPNADAVSICGVIGLIVWPCLVVAWVWAYMAPTRTD